MVTQADIPIISQRFISRTQLEQIKTRFNRLPFGEYKSDGQKIKCMLLNEDGKHLKETVVMEAVYPGSVIALKDVKKDLADLIRHVEEADKENDYLLARIKELEVQLASAESYEDKDFDVDEDFESLS